MTSDLGKTSPRAVAEFMVTLIPAAHGRLSQSRASP